ncbi:MAG: putative Nucleolar protein 56, partial [Streblomastix strix]
YGGHFPELTSITKDNLIHCKVLLLIKNKKNVSEEILPQLEEATDNNSSMAREIIEASKVSMGYDLSEVDLDHILIFAKRIVELSSYREKLRGYLVSKMTSVAPNLTALLGFYVAAQLVSHAGSLTSLAKAPASTIQILGAEKALFRALKARSNTPKYGLLFRSAFIQKALAKNKGRMSRFLANKCAIACRIDSFSEEPNAAYGEVMHEQVEERLEYLKTARNEDRTNQSKSFGSSKAGQAGKVVRQGKDGQQASNQAVPLRKNADAMKIAKEKSELYAKKAQQTKRREKGIEFDSEEEEEEETQIKLKKNKIKKEEEEDEDEKQIRKQKKKEKKEKKEKKKQQKILEEQKGKQSRILKDDDDEEVDTIVKQKKDKKNKKDKKSEKEMKKDQNEVKIDDQNQTEDETVDKKKKKKKEKEQKLEILTEEDQSSVQIKHKKKKDKKLEQDEQPVQEDDDADAKMEKKKRKREKSEKRDAEESEGTGTKRARKE